MRRRKDSYVRSNSIADVEELFTIAQGEKEYHEAREEILKRRIEELEKVIRMTRDDFVTFLRGHGIDPNYPVLSDVLSDDVVPDTVPEQSMGAVSIEQAMLPNIPNSTFLTTINLIRDNFETLHDEIEEYSDNLYKMKLQKSKLEARLDAVKKSIVEYQDKLKDRQGDYNDSVKNLEKIKALYQDLLDFRSLIYMLPNTFTSESFIKFQNSYFDRYSISYYGKKRSIYGRSTNMQENYKPTAIDQMEQGFYTVVFKDIAMYFSPYKKEDNNLPDKYVDAMPKKKEIIAKMDEFSVSLDKLIANVKVTLDSLRGVKGVGNSLVDGLITSTKEIANSFAAQKKIEHTTLESVSKDNYTVGLGVQQNVDKIKNHLQQGVDKLDERFMQSSNKFLRKIANKMGFPVNILYDRNINLEDHVREMVRRKYGGNIPFCDEDVVLGNNGKKSFVKKIDIDPKTGKSKADSQGAILEKKSRTSSNLTSAGQ